MLEVIFVILKILGIIISVLLGAVAVLLLLLLFAPIRYCSKGSKEEDVHVTARATYLNPLIRVYVEYPADRIVTVKVLGITVYPVKSVKTEEASSDMASETAENAPKVKAKASASPSVSKKLSAYAGLYQEHKDCVLETLETILKALKTILPKKCKVFTVVGTGEADTTGFLYAVYCAVVSFLPGEIYLEPVWTEQYLAGSYEVSGKIRLIHLVYATIKIVADQRVRLLIKKLRRI